MADQAIVPSASCESPMFFPCSHRRLIDEVLTQDGKETGQLRCVECGAVFNDPQSAAQVTAVIGP